MYTLVRAALGKERERKIKERERERRDLEKYYVPLCPSAVAVEMASDFNSTSQSGREGDADGETIRNAVVASVVGVGCVVTLGLLVLFAVLHCHLKKDKGQLSM